MQTSSRSSTSINEEEVLAILNLGSTSSEEGSYFL
jgi:hypothetical protein